MMSSRLRRLRSGDEGLTLVETMAAIILFALVASATTGMLLTGIKSSDQQRYRADAVSVAATQLEADRHTAISSFTTLTPPGVATFSYTVKNAQFTTTRSTEWVPKSDAANACDSAANSQGGNNGVQPVLEVTESVTWPHMGVAKPVVNQTTLTPPVGTYSSNTGSIDVSLDNSSNAPLANFPVNFQDLTAGTSQTIATDSRGCAFAAFLPAGHSFKVSTTQAGYVDNNENTTGVSTCESGGSVAVTSGNVVSCPILYDVGVAVNWQYGAGCYYGSGVGSAMTATQCPTPTELQSSPVVGVGNAGLSAPNQYAGEFTPVLSGSTLLFPYASYSIWAGHCTSAKPTSPPTSFTAKPSPVTPNPVVVPLYGLQFQVSNPSKLPITSVVAKETGTPNVCYPTSPGARTYTLPTPSSSVTNPPATLSGVPAGTYTVTVTYTKSGNATTKTSSTITVNYNGSTTPNTGGSGTVSIS